MEDSEPIYNIARKCEKLFNEHTPNDPPSVIDNLLQDYQQRFLAWTAYMGVFADTSISLDRRLKDQSDICDLIIRLFDILEEALDHLTNCNGFSESHTDAMDLGSNESCDESDDSSETNDLIEDIETSLVRLSHLGTMIRKYSTTSRTARIRTFAEQSNLSAFENLARLAVDTLYPGANESLRIQLTRSMFETCAGVLYKRSHQQRMNTPRLIQEPQMPTVNEELQETASHTEKMKTLIISDPLSLGLQKSPHRANQTGNSVALESAPSTLDSLRTKVLKKLLDPPSKIKSDCGISSVQVGKVTYPRPPQTGDSDYRTCEWCLELHPRSLFEDTKRWSAHIDKDFEPYVCLSESCMNETTLPCYATFREWLEHMNTVHTTRWQQEIHKPVFWVCSFQHSTQYFNTLEELHRHMKECYPDNFATGLYTIAKNSHIKRPRSRNICPLCCRELANNKGKNTQVGATSRKRRKIRDNEGDILNYSATPESQESSVDEQDVESPEISMARHIAEHLQISMFLAIRLIRCQSQDDECIKCEESCVVDSGDRSTTNSGASWSPGTSTARDSFDESFNEEKQKSTDDGSYEQDYVITVETDLPSGEGNEGGEEGREEDQTLKKEDEIFGGEGDGFEKEGEASQAFPDDASSNEALYGPQTNSSYPGDADDPRYSTEYAPFYAYDQHPLHAYDQYPDYAGIPPPGAYGSYWGLADSPRPSGSSLYPPHGGFSAPISFGPGLDRFECLNPGSQTGEVEETVFSPRQVRCIFHWINCKFESSNYDDWVDHIYFAHFSRRKSSGHGSAPDFGRAPTSWTCRYHGCNMVMRDDNHRSLWDQKLAHIFGHLCRGGGEPEQIHEDLVWLKYYKSMGLCYEVDVLGMRSHPPPQRPYEQGSMSWR
ncbi:hypothetical protein AOL_s00110g152 [Orbilia oligospora ATCC 24927]|uniref:C2H2-type domain-containing protein n=1 Tax=Arthrobotrys oligospora (strain ATCC 24927 / CBS 115.81 / DSM 1491) TaxID=756982 RepID=G1XKY2_ARTOA|nr:hypothetical protein AOL_s00110g152 [Orbilia oligospora ATCC 24927]EGX46328.1 hypothetical protein AOL_s00110g152 [Orbilia oligospora ATCC 24927]